MLRVLASGTSTMHVIRDPWRGIIYGTFGPASWPLRPAGVLSSAAAPPRPTPTAIDRLAGEQTRNWRSENGSCRARPAVPTATRTPAGLAADDEDPGRHPPRANWDSNQQVGETDKEKESEGDALGVTTVPIHFG
jgi:hypothetical protein